MLVSGGNLAFDDDSDSVEDKTTAEHSDETLSLACCVGSTQHLQLCSEEPEQGAPPELPVAAEDGEWVRAVNAGLALVKQWVDKALPYSQKKYCNPEGTSIRSKQYPGSYRTDCSGLVSMAWGLPRSYTTRRLFLGTFPGAERILRADKKMSKDNARGITPACVAVLIAWEDLRPGDMLYKVGHVMIVAEITPNSDAPCGFLAAIYHQTPKPGAHRSIMRRQDCKGDMETGYMATCDDRHKRGIRIWWLRNNGWC